MNRVPEHFRYSSNMTVKMAACLLTLLFMLSHIGVSLASPKRPLMRFPDVHENSIVFVYGEDIWSIQSSGGIATRLTIHDGAERFPKFSPDGTMIAFTGEYDGNADVYVMNVHGGDIKRVTYHPYDDEVIGWHPVENKILFSSYRNSFGRFLHLFLVSPDGTDIEELILHEASQGSFSPDGKKIAYNRDPREFRTWKRYKGGLAQDIFLFDFEKNKDRKLTTFEGTDRTPMWIGDKIYFSSDRNRILNIYAYDTKTEKVEQITKHKEYDVRRPSMGGNKIVYELGGTLWLLDTDTKETKQIPVEIRTDAPELRPYIKSVDEHITGFDCSPSGERALIVARGEVFTVPKEEGPTRNLTRDSGSRDKDAVWSPDGKRIAYLSDKSGEYEIYIVDPMGKEEAVRLTQHKDGYRHTLRWSPDSKKIAFADQTLRCYYLDVDSKKITEVDKAEHENVDVSIDLKPIHDFAWSPDSRYLAYSKMDADIVYKVYIYSLETGKARCVSNGIFNDFGPLFSKDGEHLFFISNRRFDPTFCDFEWEMVYKKVAGIYCLTLRKDGEPLLPSESDEEEIEEKEDDGKKEKGKEDKDDKDEATKVVIDFDGISERIEALPLSRGNYRNLAVNENAIFYLNKDEGDFNRFEFRRVGPMDLYRFSFDDREEKVVIEGVDGYKLSADGKHVVYRKRDSIGIIDASATDSQGKALDLSDLKMHFDPLAEWKQIFNEAWRMERDFYYEPNMHGLDWNAMKEKYGRLLPYVSCRQDMRFLIGELIGELNTSHTYVYGGDFKREAESVNVGMLGVDWEVDKASNRYRFGKIYRVPDWTREILPPLARPGIHVKKGDYLLQVNGEDVTTDRNIYSYFQDLADKQVAILVNSKPSNKGAAEYTVEPIRGEYTLRYLDWVEHNRLLAEEESNGQIGYIHLPDTYTGSAREFPKYFYSQSRKKGLIVDGRFNGGGLDPDIFLQRLDKKVLGYWTRRYSHDQMNPNVASRAHMVCLTNRQAGSGGDMLPMEFQMKGMGPVIGTRTWGGLVGVSMFIRLIDGGGLTAPDYRIYDPSGKWVVENKGVEPDIVVDLDPVEVARAYDAQLMKAIEILKQRIKEDPRPWPKHESFEVDK
ncbi:MAG: peptidase S41 [Candidatus Latescibacteria bacterium]|nr:peptidase S41 [Candidatus Latescibacterota bacterium]NIO28443.1 peptidase S41 [Candidatus Latescibacterota bacterium]NIO55992.1 peptidase S41 [Candidatus Latescibacterota bacterium]NIT01956.1 peptidase S41 [Candidatus Latescibacterota bacterium]